MWHKRILAGFVLVTLTLVGIQAAVAQGAGLGLPEEVADYFRWERGNAQKSFEESAHPVAKDIYLNELAAETARASSFPYSVDSTFIKERTDPETLLVTTLYAMRKVEGFDPNNGNWQYGVFEREDAGAFGGGWMSVADAEGCIGCHTGAADTDYTFLSYLGE